MHFGNGVRKTTGADTKTQTHPRGTKRDFLWRAEIRPVWKRVGRGAGWPGGAVWAAPGTGNQAPASVAAVNSRAYNI